MKKLISLALALFCAASLPAAVRVAVLGDSYSTFQGAVEPAGNEVWYFSPRNPEMTDVDSVAHTWWGIFFSDPDYELVRNNSYSGATVCNRGYNGDDYSARSFINRMSDLGDPELILVFGATNDFWAHVALDPESAASPEPNEMYTFTPALRYLLQQLPAIYPGARVVFMLNDIIDGPVREAVLRECEASGTPCLQLRDIDKQMGHPTRAGMASIAAQLKDFLAR